MYNKKVKKLKRNGKIPIHLHRIDLHQKMTTHIMPKTILTKRTFITTIMMISLIITMQKTITTSIMSKYLQPQNRRSAVFGGLIPLTSKNNNGLKVKLPSRLKVYYYEVKPNILKRAIPRILLFSHSNSVFPSSLPVPLSFSLSLFFSHFIRVRAECSGSMRMQ